MTTKVLWDVVKAAAARANIEKLAPHDLRRTWARLCHLAGGERIKFSFFWVTCRSRRPNGYLGCMQKLRVAVNDTLGIEPADVG